MRVIYVAGRYRARTKFGILLNILKARRASTKLARMGWYVFCPHTNTAFLDGVRDDRFWLDCGLEFLRRCDAVFFTKNWVDSIGATKEHSEAVIYKKEIYYEIVGYPEP